ncbi:hypothetical protein TNCV_3157331 [Trichonephila clavipes]|nr:hypothetical protein TNCV_3157331 [Trichonephila clavipes]
MLIQQVSSEPGLVRGTVDLLENSITGRITEQHKRMGVITQNLCVRRVAPQQVLCNDTLVGQRLPKSVP